MKCFWSGEVNEMYFNNIIVKVVCKRNTIVLLLFLVNWKIFKGLTEEAVMSEMELWSNVTDFLRGFILVYQCLFNESF